MMIDESLRDWLINTLGNYDEDIDWEGKIQQNLNAQITASPRINYIRTSTENELFLANVNPITTTNYDLEVVSEDIGQGSEIAEYIKTEIHGFHGDMGDNTIHLAEYSDHDDDYVPFSIGSDDGLHVFSLHLSIIWS